MNAIPRVENPWAGAPVVVKESTFSTMDDAFALAMEGHPSGTVVAAGFQEEGRGRVPGRKWIAPPWECLLATLILRGADAAFPLFQLPLRIGLAVCLAVEPCAGIALRIKWPNDIMCGGKKIAGILCESRGGVLLVGIGVNCLQREFPPELAPTACSIRQVSGRTVDVYKLLSRVLSAVKEALAEDSWREALAGRLYRRGEPARVDLIGLSQTVEGIVQGVDEDGALVLRAADGSLLRVRQGEIRTGG